MSATPTLVRDGQRVLLARHFTKNLSSPYDGIKWVKRSAKISEKDGTVVFQMDDIEAPDFWSQLAVDIAASKYFRKAGVPVTGREISVRQMIDRVAGAIANQGVAQGYFDVDTALVLKDELTYLLVHQYAAFNSPVWFNAGLAEHYNARGSASGLWAVDKAGVAHEMPDAYTRPALSACFIQTVDDNLMGIADGVKREMRVFKMGGGSGANYSNLRAEGESLSGGGKSSGVMSFLGIFDAAAGAIKSGGTVRRAARMVVLNVDHPDIETFVEWKVREEKKVAALVAAGYSSDFNGEAYRTVGGQNANNSVRVDDTFMNVVKSDGDWSTIYRTNKKIAKTFKARSLMRKIAEAAHECADPGMQFDTTCNAWHTSPESGRINASNPCAEYVYVDNSACNLASLNLQKFMDDRGFDVEGFCHAIDVFITAMDLIVDYASYPTKEIAENSHNLRPLGLGYANLGALLMRLGLPYDSTHGRTVCGMVTSLMTARAYRRSSQLAAGVGPFKGFAFNRQPMLGVIRRHFDAMDKIPPFVTAGSEALTEIYSSLNTASIENWQDAYSFGGVHGYRNGQATLLAPTGTIGLLMDCDTTGIEPDYALVKYKKLAGGGSFKIVNQSIGPALGHLGYRLGEVDGILKYIEQKNTIEGAPYLKPEHLAVFDCAAKNGETGQRALAPMSHLHMMAAAQPFLSGAISKTVNCPEETTVEEIEKIYITAWELGLKAVAVYREGSKICAILSGKSEKKSVPAAQPFVAKLEEQLADHKANRPPERHRLPKRRKGFTQEVMIGEHKLYLRTGDYEDGKLGEVFLDMHKQGATMSAMLDSFAKLLSISIQHGVPLEELVEVFIHTKFEPKGIVRHDPNVKIATSILDYVFRTLAIEYLGRTDLANRPPEERGQIESHAVTKAPIHLNGGQKKVAYSNKAGETCAACGDITVRAGTCTVCVNCGTNSGCG